MPFQAITEAPFLREGINLSFMAIPQAADGPPTPFEIGSVINLRLGYCCPSLCEGRITALTKEPPRAVLRAAGRDWSIEPGRGNHANTIPGIRSEVWRIR